VKRLYEILRGVREAYIFMSTRLVTDFLYMYKTFIGMWTLDGKDDKEIKKQPDDDQNHLVASSLLTAFDKERQIGMPHFADVYEKLAFMMDFVVHRHLQKLRCWDFCAKYVCEI
jgi:hypothetical protein